MAKIIWVVMDVFVAVLDGLTPEYPYYMRSRPAPADAAPFSCVCVVRATLQPPLCYRFLQDPSLDIMSGSSLDLILAPSAADLPIL